MRHSWVIFFVVKMRMYWKMIEILVNTRERLYMGMVAQRACGGKNS
jgi:hypothetical protein